MVKTNLDYLKLNLDLTLKFNFTVVLKEPIIFLPHKFNNSFNVPCCNNYRFSLSHDHQNHSTNKVKNQRGKRK